jgi:hypothetical protein
MHGRQRLIPCVAQAVEHIAHTAHTAHTTAQHTRARHARVCVPEVPP